MSPHMSEMPHYSRVIVALQFTITLEPALLILPCIINKALMLIFDMWRHPRLTKERGFRNGKFSQSSKRCYFVGFG